MIVRNKSQVNLGGRIIFKKIPEILYVEKNRKITLGRKERKWLAKCNVWYSGLKKTPTVLGVNSWGGNALRLAERLRLD